MVQITPKCRVVRWYRIILALGLKEKAIDGDGFTSADYFFRWHEDRF